MKLVNQSVVQPLFKADGEQRSVSLFLSHTTLKKFKENIQVLKTILLNINIYILFFNLPQVGDMCNQI